LPNHRRAHLVSIGLLLAAVAADEAPSLGPVWRDCLEDAFVRQDSRTAAMLLTAHHTHQLGLADLDERADPPALLTILPPMPEHLAWTPPPPGPLPENDRREEPRSSVATMQVVDTLQRLADAAPDRSTTLTRMRALAADPGQQSVPARVIAAHSALLTGLDPQEALQWVADDDGTDLSAGRRAMLDHVRGLAEGDLTRLAGAVHGFSDVGWLRRSAVALADLTTVSAGTSEPAVATRTALVREARLAHDRALARHDPTTTPLLTPRETEIVRLAAQGRSNREIAQQAFLSVRTVESHLYHATRKLGVTSRRELPTAMARHDAVPP
ncbi:MAG: LuxR C-terminal-related transcriptional regulator, partial [Propionibacteriales bacterium]|nr:LuxR C-terminal-related transcriptional regulator [Propionibacteriales bacterium]